MARGRLAFHCSEDFMSIVQSGTELSAFRAPSQLNNAATSLLLEFAWAFIDPMLGMILYFYS